MRQNAVSHQQVSDGAQLLLMWGTLAQDSLSGLSPSPLALSSWGWGDLLLIVLEDAILDFLSGFKILVEVGLEWREGSLFHFAMNLSGGKEPRKLLVQMARWEDGNI